MELPYGERFIFKQILVDLCSTMKDLLNFELICGSRCVSVWLSCKNGLVILHISEGVGNYICLNII